MNIRTDLAVEAVGVLKSKHKEYKKALEYLEK